MADDVLGVLVHELRTPVSSIRALTRALRPGSTSLSPEARREALLLVHEHTEHIAALLEDVRELGERLRVARDPAHLRDEVARLRSSPADRAEPVVLGRVLAAAADAAGVPRAKLQLSVDPLAEVVVVDAVALRRIVTNLLENAVRHGPAGAGMVAIRADARADALVLQVRDGSDARQEPTGPTSELLPATHGIGLTVVEQLVRDLGGHLDVRPIRDGRVVEVVLPTRPAVVVT